MNIKKILNARNEILEGVKNSIFKKEAVEVIAKERNEICKSCDFLDEEGTKCYVAGTQPCCGSCGCSLKIKQRSLSSDCPEGFWDPVLTEDEELDHDALNSEEDAD